MDVAGIQLPLAVPTDRPLAHGHSRMLALRSRLAVGFADLRSERSLLTHRRGTGTDNH
jgi:hypothetical protein